MMLVSHANWATACNLLSLFSGGSSVQGFFMNLAVQPKNLQSSNEGEISLVRYIVLIN
jgi:hypothetical protein